MAATKDVIFIRNVLSFMERPVTTATPLMIDNKGMWHNSRNVGISERTKHWEIWQQFVREMNLKGVIKTHLIGTDDEVADIFTKALPTSKLKFNVFRNYIMNVA